LGNTSAKSKIKNETKTTLMIKLTSNESDRKSLKIPSSNKLEIIMIPMFTKLLAINIDANRVLGCSNKLTILLNEGCFLVFKILTSLELSEKNATSLPESKKDKRKSTKTATIKIVVAAEETIRKILKCDNNSR
jgi:hypothetical protein